MERLTSYKNETSREMICRYEDCDVCEEYCPHMQEDNCFCLQEILEKLGQYEDAEEQGLLLRLPKELSNIDKRIIEYSLVKAMNLVRYGIEVDDRLENATQISCAINQAYMMGRQEERNRFRELRKEEAEQKLAEMKGK